MAELLPGARVALSSGRGVSAGRVPVGEVIEPNGFVRGPTVETWEAQIEALRAFVKARLSWMDSELQ